MSHPKSNKTAESNLKTANGWATALRRDRRTIATKLRPLPPEGRANGYPTYSLASVLKSLEPPPDTSDLGQQKKAQEVRKLKTYNDRKDGLLVERSRVKESITKFGTRVDALCSQKENEWPSLLAGLEAPAIRAYLKRGFDQVRQEVSDSYGEWTC